MKYNSPPNWPPPPEGWTPESGWTPDPSWGPAPEGWQFWTEEAPAPPPPPAAAKPAAGNWFARHKVLTGLGVVLIVLVAIGIANGGSSGGEKPTDATKPAPIASVPSTPAPSSAAPSPAAVTTTKPATLKPPVPAKLLSFKGSGIKKSVPFTATKDQWRIAYSFNCSNFGQSGNFQIYVEQGTDMTDIAANDLAKKHSGTTEEYGAGKYHLQVNSECSWQITVTQ